MTSATSRPSRQPAPAAKAALEVEKYLESLEDSHTAAVVCDRSAHRPDGPWRGRAAARRGGALWHLAWGRHLDRGGAYDRRHSRPAGFERDGDDRARRPGDPAHPRGHRARCAVCRRLRGRQRPALSDRCHPPLRARRLSEMLGSVLLRWTSATHRRRGRSCGRDVRAARPGATRLAAELR